MVKWIINFIKSLFIKEEKMSQKLIEDDFIEASELLDVDVASIKAVTEVESSGSGFDENGNIKLLFEGHIFYKYLKQAGYNVKEIAEVNPDICYKTWRDKRDTYKLNQFERLKKATLINEEIAYKSASYGLFQIMGFNCEACGFNTARDMYSNLILSEKNHLLAFCKFIKSNKSMYRCLQNHDWSGFAKLYNGPGYKANKYDTKLEKAYKKYKGE